MYQASDKVFRCGMLVLVAALTGTRSFSTADERAILFGGDKKEDHYVTVIHTSTAGGDLIVGFGPAIRSKPEGVVVPTGAPGVTFFVPKDEYLSAFVTATGDHDASIIAWPAARCNRCGT